MQEIPEVKKNRAKEVVLGAFVRRSCVMQSES